MDVDSTDNTFKSGFVTISGKPNAGKSTLMNALLDRKLSIVSPRPQTTRHRVLGILNGNDHQIIFLDTPGLIEPKYSLQKAMVEAAKRSLAEDADLVLFLMDVAQGESVQPSDLDASIMEALAGSRSPKFLLLNKIDLMHKSVLLPVMEEFHKTGMFSEIVPISALKRDGLDLLLSLVKKYLPDGPPLYPPDAITEHPERFFVSEIIRERVFFEYADEIPYAVAVRVTEFRESPGRKDFVAAEIVVERDSQKGILIGAKGGALKKLGTHARLQIERFLGRPVYLELQVRVEKNWRKNEAEVKRFGY
jgi:GTP-binding protein Era